MLFDLPPPQLTCRDCMGRFDLEDCAPDKAMKHGRKKLCKPCAQKRYEAWLSDYRRRYKKERVWHRFRAHGDELYRKQRGLCNGCKDWFRRRNLEIDHIIPRFHGGGDELANIQLLCNACNMAKHTHPMEHLLKRLDAEGVTPFNPYDAG